MILETIKGQDILLKDFGKGAFSMVMTEGLSSKEKVVLEDRMKQVDHVASVISHETALDASVPMEILPDKYKASIQKGDTSLMAVFLTRPHPPMRPWTPYGKSAIYPQNNALSAECQLL